MLLRVQGETPPEDLVYIAESLERCQTESVVNCLLRQKSDDMAQCYIEICKSDKAIKTLDILRKQGLDQGPEPGEEHCITEGQIMEVKFRGNVDFEDEEEKSFRFVYNSHRNSAKRAFYIKEIDKYSQHGLPFYRGHVQVYKVLEGKESETTDGKEECLISQIPSTDMMCETPVILPKVRLFRFPGTQFTLTCVPC